MSRSPAISRAVFTLMALAELPNIAASVRHRHAMIAPPHFDAACRHCAAHACATQTLRPSLTLASRRQSPPTPPQRAFISRLSMTRDIISPYADARYGSFSADAICHFRCPRRYYFCPLFFRAIFTPRCRFQLTIHHYSDVAALPRRQRAAARRGSAEALDGCYGEERRGAAPPPRQRRDGAVRCAR